MLFRSLKYGWYLIGFSLSDKVSYSVGCYHNLKSSDSSLSVSLRKKLLSQYPFQNFGELYSYLLLLMRRKYVYHTVYRVFDTRTNSRRASRTKIVKL